ncbi:MAG: RluA family pseudouridine synthase [Caldilineaceae bacterium]|nr:RluA family pseudouridine synthase [Caldilineaceae bacterium]
MDRESRDVRRFTIPPSAAGQRLDRWLTDRFEEESRSAIQRWIAEGLITVNGQRAGKAGMPLEAGAEIEVAPPPAAVAASLRPENIPLDIIFEDDNLLVVDKPAGLVVHPGPGHAAGTLANAVLHHCPQLQGIGGEKRPGIVHRLDKGTSGVIVVAKNDAAMRFVQEQFAGRTVYKEYLALLEGRVEPPRGRIDAPIGRHPTRRQRMAVLPAFSGPKSAVGTGQTASGAREAVTEYECLQVYEDRSSGQTARFSLVRVVLHTGRTHQIRAHFAWRRHPVAGDAEYGYKRRRLSLTRPFLHAHRLGIRLPGEAEQRLFESPLPAELQYILDRLGE